MWRVFSVATSMALLGLAVGSILNREGIVPTVYQCAALGGLVALALIALIDYAKGK